jgi:hypothetical protein
VLIATIALMALAPLIPITTGVLRRVAHERREQRDGLGGTQDIAMWGTLVMFLWLVATLTCLVLALDRGELPIR